MGWIKCSDADPDIKDYEWVLVYLDYGLIEKALYDKIDGFTDGDCYSFGGKVTHWQPLPEPPTD